MKRFKIGIILIITILVATISSCTSKEQDAKTKMLEAGYTLLDTDGIYKPTEDIEVTNIYYYAYGKDKADAIQNLINNGDWLIAIYFKDSETAQIAYSDFLNGTAEERSAKIKGKCIYYGTDKAISIFE